MSSTKKMPSKNSDLSLSPSEASTRIRELEVLQGELKSMRKGGRVYKQQPNSSIFFRENMEKVFSDAKLEMDELIKEYKDVERTTEKMDGANEG